MITSRTKNIAVVLGISTAVILIACYGLYYLTKKKVESTKTLEAQVQEYTESEDKDRALKALLTESEPNITELQSRIVAADGTVSFIEAVESLARHQNILLKVKSVNVEPYPTQKELFEQLKLEISMEGSWENCYTFASVVENLPYKIRVQNVSFVRQGEAVKGASPWAGAMSIVVLKYK
jgi:Tfp pilus assembly protein PilO